MNFAVVDFETEPIRPRPEYPPRPVGVGIHAPWQRAKYFAWGHLSRNNCSYDEGRAALARVYDSGLPIVCHNAKFDLDIAEEHLKLPLPSWERIHCTQILAFLYHPDAFNISLKELGKSILEIEPEERDALREWIFDHIPGAKARKARWGQHICEAPGDIVGRYVKLDLRLPRLLFEKLYAYVQERQMQGAYNRERELLPILLKMERRGVPINAEALSESNVQWERAGLLIDEWIRKRLKVPELDIDSGPQLVEALIENEFTRNPNRDAFEWPATKKGALSTSMKVIPGVVTDKDFLEMFTYRNRLTTALRTFGRPWETMSAQGGRIYTIWNQTKRDDESKRRNAGARTGRLSSQPNFQNIPKKPELIVHTLREKAKFAKAGEKVLRLPRSARTMLEKENMRIEIPNMRGFIQCDTGMRLGLRDYSQQELRILAYFEDGQMLQLYRDDPKVDFHALARELIIVRTGRVYARSNVKTTGFGIIYGQGLELLSETMEITKEEAKSLRAAYKATFPGIRDVEDLLRFRASKDKPLRTWGGREYYCEPPGWSEKHQRWMTYEYKMLNTLIQGSAADCTKEAMLRYDKAAVDGKMLVQVHDELLIQTPIETFDREMKVLRETMESVEFDVPMLSDGKAGETWGSATKYEDIR